VHRFKKWIGAAILAVAAIVLFTWNYPTTAVVVWTTVIVLVALAIREFLDPGPTPPTDAAAT
jgi:membrane protein implicated in regulation of membrane protease activity